MLTAFKRCLRLLLIYCRYLYILSLPVNICLFILSINQNLYSVRSRSLLRGTRDRGQVENNSLEKVVALRTRTVWEETGLAFLSVLTISILHPAFSYPRSYLTQFSSCYTSMYHSFIHSGQFYSAPSSSLPLRGAPDYSTDTVSEFHAEAHRQLQVAYVTTKAGVEPTTLRLKVIDSTKAPSRPTRCGT